MPGETAVAIGSAIRRAREQRGLSQGALADLVGKTQSAVSFWEMGRRTPDLEDVVVLARELDLDLDEILGVQAARQPTKVLLRAAVRAYPDEFAEALMEFMDTAEERSAPAVELRIANDSPVGAALELLAKAGLTEPPVDVHALARLCGARVFSYRFAEGVSGLLLELESGPVIGYDEVEPLARQRFTIAHELGHHLLRHHDNFHFDPTATAADGHPPGYDWKDERAANEFAAQLLMPATWVSKYAKRFGQTSALAKAFGVSTQAMSYRLANLDLG